MNHETFKFIKEANIYLEHLGKYHDMLDADKLFSQGLSIIESQAAEIERLKEVLEWYASAESVGQKAREVFGIKIDI